MYAPVTPPFIFINSIVSQFVHGRSDRGKGILYSKDKYLLTIVFIQNPNH